MLLLPLRCSHRRSQINRMDSELCHESCCKSGIPCRAPGLKDKTKKASPLKEFIDDRNANEITILTICLANYNRPCIPQTSHVRVVFRFIFKLPTAKLVAAFVIAFVGPLAKQGTSAQGRWYSFRPRQIFDGYGYPSQPTDPFRPTNRSAGGGNAQVEVGVPGFLPKRLAIWRVRE